MPSCTIDSSTSPPALAIGTPGYAVHDRVRARFTRADQHSFAQVLGESGAFGPLEHGSTRVGHRVDIGPQPVSQYRYRYKTERGVAQLVQGEVNVARHRRSQRVETDVGIATRRSIRPSEYAIKSAPPGSSATCVGARLARIGHYFGRLDRSPDLVTGATSERGEPRGGELGRDRQRRSEGEPDPIQRAIHAVNLG